MKKKLLIFSLVFVCVIALCISFIGDKSWGLAWEKIFRGNVLFKAHIVQALMPDGGNAGDITYIQGYSKNWLQGTGAMANGTTNVKVTYIDSTPVAEWTGTDADIVTSKSTILYKQGTECLGVTISSGAVAGDKVTNPLNGDEDWTGIENLGVWVYSTRFLAAGDLDFRITDNPAGDTDIDLPVMVKDSWTWCPLDISAVPDVSKDVITDIHFVYTVDIGVVVLYFDFLAKWDDDDDVALAKNIIQDGMLTVIANPVAAGTAMAWLAKAEYTNYFISYEATDLITPITDESLNCFVMLYAYE